jgi:predicted nuclease of predicted toxin-antitoxin system
LKIQFQADADLDPDIGRGLVRRKPAIGWRGAQGIPDRTLDPEMLRIAAGSGRVLVSRDVRTLPGHFAAFIARRVSPGIILIPSGITIGAAIERLLIAWLTWTAEEMENQIRWLPDSPRWDDSA